MTQQQQVSLPVPQNVYVFATQAKAQACQAAVDAAMAMPHPGVNAGSGAHAPANQSATVTYFVPVQNPNTLQWGYLADANTTPILTPLAATLNLPAPSPYDSTWNPPGTV